MDEQSRDSDQTVPPVCDKQVVCPSHCSTSQQTSLRRVDRAYHEKKTCHICITRRLESYDSEVAEMFASIKSCIESNNCGKLVRALEVDYPECLLLDCFFLAVEREAWKCFDVLLMEKSANTWLQFCNEKGENILQRILCKPRVHKEGVTERVMNVLGRLQYCMTKDCLKEFVNKKWKPQPEPPMFIMYKHASPLQMAISECHSEVAIELLKCGADPNLDSGNGRTPLCYAARRGHLDMIDILLAHGACINRQEPEYMRHNVDNPLHALGYMYEQYDDNNGLNSPVCLLIETSIRRGNLSRDTKIRLLNMIKTARFVYFREYCDLLPCMDKELISLIVAKSLPLRVVNTDEAVIEVNRDADDLVRVPSSSEIKQCVFSITAFCGISDVLEILCKSSASLGIDINECSIVQSLNYTGRVHDIYNCTALQSACRSGHHSNVACLLSNGADPDWCGNRGLPIMHINECAHQGAIKCAIHLLRHGCSLNTMPYNSTYDYSGDPLGCFLQCNQLFVVKMLVVAGAGPSVPKRRGHYPVFRESIPSNICDKQMKESIMREFEVVPSLIQLSRTAVRRSLYRGLPSKIQTLPLPLHVKEYLNLPELDEIERQFNKVEAQLITLAVNGFMSSDSEDSVGVEFSDSSDSDT